MVRQGVAEMRRDFNESAFILITVYTKRVPDKRGKICIANNINLIMRFHG